MAEDKTFTKAEVDAMIEAAVAKVGEKVDELSSKNAGLLDDLKKAQREVRAAKDIKPEDLAAESERADKAEAALNEATKNLKAITTERDKAMKALETEQGAARTYALDAEINSAIASGNIVPALVPAFMAMVKQQAKADLVDGKYAVSIGDKPATDYIKTFLESEDGKAFKAAPINGGGGSPGGQGQGGSGKTIPRSQFDGLSQPERVTFAKEGGKVVDA
jgi:hypothetical protein